MVKANYIPQKQDIIWIDFDPSLGREIQKRRPALVMSRGVYAQQTGLVAVCPITHGQERLKKRGLLVPVEVTGVDGYVNPLQMYTFDYERRKAQKAGVLDTWSFQKVVQLFDYIFND